MIENGKPGGQKGYQFHNLHFLVKIKFLTR